jgi:hypothetical protein
MRPAEAIIYHLGATFPLLAGEFHKTYFVWKLVAFALCLFLSYRDPRRYVWSALFALGTIPVLSALIEVDPVSLVMRSYLLWMCAEITFRSLAAEPLARMRAWWLFGLFLIFVL